MGPKVSKGRAESPLVASAEAKPSVKREEARKVFPLPSTRNLFFCATPLLQGPEGFQRASGKPFGRLRRGETLRKTEGERKVFPLPSTRNQFLVGGFVRLRADEVLSHTGKYPKGAGGGQRVHVSWPPPDPPLLRNSAPLASQGRAQLGSRPSLGGPLSPSAQLIPPPAPRRRSILGVPARGRCGRTTLPQYVPRHRGHARCVPAPAPDWLLAPGQTKWRARCGPCRSSDKGKCPYRYKGGPGVSLGRLKGV